MANRERIDEIKRVITTRLDALSHIVDIGEAHFTHEASLLGSRLAADMQPFGTQIAFACNPPLALAQWCAGLPVQNLDREVTSLAQARDHIATTRAQVAAIDADDSQLQAIKRVGLGPEMYCELPGLRYVDDFVLPNLYFHVTTAYAILRNAGAALGKADFMTQLAGDVRKVDA